MILLNLNHLLMFMLKSNRSIKVIDVVEEVRINLRIDLEVISQNQITNNSQVTVVLRIISNYHTTVNRTVVSPKITSIITDNTRSVCYNYRSSVSSNLTQWYCQLCDCLCTGNYGSVWCEKITSILKVNLTYSIISISARPIWLAAIQW